MTATTARAAGESFGPFLMVATPFALATWLWTSGALERAGCALCSGLLMLLH